MDSEIDFVRKTSAFMGKRSDVYSKANADERISYSDYLDSIEAEMPYRVLGFADDRYMPDTLANLIRRYFRVLPHMH